MCITYGLHADREASQARAVATFAANRYKPQAASHKLHDTSDKLQATSYRLQATGTGYKLQATGHMLQATGYRLQVTSHELHKLRVLLQAQVGKGSEGLLSEMCRELVAGPDRLL